MIELSKDRRQQKSKYDSLWKYVQEKEEASFQLTFEEIQKIAGIPIDHLRRRRNLDIGT